MIFSSSTTLGDVIDQLAAANHISAETAATISETLSTQVSEKSTPWYMQAIIGIAAWLAAIPFIGFLVTVLGLDSTATMLTLGLIFCAGAVVARPIFRKSLLVAQLALAFSLAGHLLLIAGLADQLDSISAIALVIIILEIVLIVFYADGLHRFLSCLIISIALLTIIFDNEMQEMIHIVIIGLALGSVGLWECESFLATRVAEQLYRPVGYGLVVSLLFVLILSIVNIFGEQLVDVNYWWFSTITLLLILLVLAYYVLTGPQLNATLPLIGLIIGAGLVVFLPTLQVPGIVAAVLVLVLGFHRGNPGLMGLAAAFLVVFFIAFYYNLALTLLIKSLILMTTGVILFGLRFLLQKRLDLTETSP